MSANSGPTSSTQLDIAHNALAYGAWEVARAWFEEALDRVETPEALEGLATAAWWQNDAAATFRAREGAYRLYRERGDRRGAARVAAFHAVDYCSLRNEPAVANGWIRRAYRLLEGLDPTPEHAMVALWEGHIVLMTRHDVAMARRLSAQGGAVARALGEIDWEMLALALEGLALVSAGEVDEGMRRLDEAATAAAAGEMTNLDAIGTVCCYLIYACERVRDYDRAAQWCQTVKAVSARWSSCLVFSLCRTHYAGLLIWQGAWSEAETELNAAVRDLTAIHPTMAADAIARLAELRRRQGRAAEATALFRQAESQPLRRLGSNYVLLGRAAVALDEGDATTAADLAERFLRGLGDEAQLERVAGLELFVRAQTALGQQEKAADTVSALWSISTEVGTPTLRASASLSEGIVALSGGDYATARRRFEDAIDLFERSGGSYETALARLELAGVLSALGRDEAAKDEAGTALAYLQEIGADREVVRATTLLRQLETPNRGHANDAGSVARLTSRQKEILGLVAQGLTNKEIAAQLALSEHTIHRHLANILAKLDLPSRAAAAAYSARHDRR